jgi:hypothetical protein
MQVYATGEATKRDNGQSNAIDPILAGTPAEGMRSDDFMNYCADMPAGYV